MSDTHVTLTWKPGMSDQPGNSYWRERLSTVDLLIKMGCFVKKENLVPVWKAADLNSLVQGGQLYRYFPFSKASLDHNLI